MTGAAKKVPPLPGPYSVTEAINRVLAVAGSQIGVHEGKSKSGEWNNDQPYGVWYGMNFAAWCAIFVSWCSSTAGFLRIIPKHAYTPSGFEWFRARALVGGRVPPNKVGKAATGLGKPKRGDVMYVYSSSQGRIHHVGYVENVLPGGYISTIEGNTNTTGSVSGDGVYRLKRKVTANLYFASPNYSLVVVPRPKPAPGAKPPALDKYGQPKTGGRLKTDKAGKQILELNWLIAGAKFPAGQSPTFMLWTQMNAAAGSLKAIGLMPKAAALTGPNFKAGWMKWQKSLGYKGADADGIPGTASFSRLIERSGRSKSSPGYKAK